jgi:ParB/RepB/Spo0J family partition protein
MREEKLPARVEDIPIDLITVVNPRARNRKVFGEIVRNIADLGLKRPVTVVRRDRQEGPRYELVCGQGRLEAYQALGQREIPAVIVDATDDDGMVMSLVENIARRQHRAIDLLHDIEGLKKRDYKEEEIAHKTGLTVEYVRGVKRISRLAIIQEHRMILRAIESGASEERIARALNVDVGNIKRKRRLLDGICPEAAEILKDKHLSVHAFGVLKKMAPLRQIEAAELMVAMNKYATSYARSLLAATPQDQLVAKHRPKKIRGLRPEQVAMMERESASLDREFKMAEQSYGTDHLDLVLAKGYLGKILGNTRVARYLEQNHLEILVEFRKFVEIEPATGGA